MVRVTRSIKEDVYDLRHAIFYAQNGSSLNFSTSRMTVKRLSTLLHRMKRLHIKMANKLDRCS
jgi:hypothetical protein